MNISKKRREYYTIFASCVVLGGVSSYFSVLVWMGQISGFPLRIVEFSLFALLALLFCGPVLISEGPKALWGAILLVPAGYVNPFYVFDSSGVGVPVIGLLFGLPLLAIGIGAIFHIISGKLKKEEDEAKREKYEKMDKPYCPWEPGVSMNVWAKACAECISMFSKTHYRIGLELPEEMEKIGILFERKHDEKKMERVYLGAFELLSVSADASDDDLADALIQCPWNILDAHEARALFGYARKKVCIEMAGIEAGNNIGVISGIGSCHVYWGEQKRILKEKYGIDWETPSEENPLWRID